MVESLKAEKTHQTGIDLSSDSDSSTGRASVVAFVVSADSAHRIRKYTINLMYAQIVDTRLSFLPMQ